MTVTDLPLTEMTRPVQSPQDVEVQVHHSVRHLLICAGGLASAATAGTGVAGLALAQYVELSKWLLILAALLVTCTLLVIADAAREGRHWRYAEDLGPADLPVKG